LLNIVKPDGAIAQESAPFTLFGNRNVIHRDHKIVKPFSRKDWIYCVTSALTDPRDFMRPKLFTELFFLDEATALAAGHRPCHLCNRQRFEEFFESWSSHFEVAKPTVKVVDDELHRYRIDDDDQKVTFLADCGALPDGVMIKIKGAIEPFLVHGGGILPWTTHGYGIKAPRPESEVEVLTPRPIVELMNGGFTIEPRNPLLAW